MKLAAVFRPFTVAPSPSTSVNEEKNVPMTNPVVLQRTEAGVLFVLALVLYARTDAGWPLFALLVLVPDLGMLGYLAGPRIGAATYNTVHAAVLPAALALGGILSGNATITAVATIWLAHIAFDRLMGYGFKLPTAFGDTHLSRKGRA